MAHFALVRNGIVERVHVLVNEVILDSDGIEQEVLGQKFLANLHGYDPSELVQCSYNGNMRVRFPAPGFSYDLARDAFIAPKPFPSWVFDDDTCSWEAPVLMPEEIDADGNPVSYIWDEGVEDWVPVNG